MKTEYERLLDSQRAKEKYPLEPKVCCAVTGTNGKSSIVHFVNQIWQNCGVQSACLGTNGICINGEYTHKLGDFETPHLTTPGPFDLHKILHYMALKKVTHCAFEASSHAIDQKRLHSVSLSSAAITNIASDHLDYHKTYQQYLAAKLKLFDEIVPKDKTVIVSKDNVTLYNKIKEINKNILSCGFDVENDIFPSNIRKYLNKTIFDLNFNGEVFNDISINLFGDIQLNNVFFAISLVHITSNNMISMSDIVNSLKTIKPLDGRLEYINSYNGGAIYVDYAHTSEGFKKVLMEFKSVCKGRLISVFGCGGDRDKTKRAEMGKYADQISDVVIVTDDNPRTEDPASIRQSIIQQCSDPIEIGNRRCALEYAICILKENDILVVIGKGHETVQIYKDQILPHNDRQVIQEIINANCCNDVTDFNYI